MYTNSKIATILCGCILCCVLVSTPLLAFECDNVGAAAATLPDDTGDGFATACGPNAVAGGFGSTALGVFASSAGSESIALGASASSAGNSSTALGYLASSAANFSTALGYRAQADQDYSLVLGSITGVNGATQYTDVGIGTTTPDTPLHVHRDDGSAQILVSETGAPATRTLFELQNPGRTHFKITNTDAGSQWVFTNTGTAFFISLQGTGGPEFKILNNGNAVLAGVLTEGSDINTKTAITDIDDQEILNLVSALPVTKWEYKDARGEVHIGPMAQDFYAAFGLGNSEAGIATIDTAGVALAAIKALAEKNTALETQNLSLELRVAELEQQNQRIEELVMRMVTERAEQVAMN